MNKKELFKRIDSTFAYDTGCTGERPSYEERTALKADLIKLCKPNEAYPNILAEFVKDMLTKSYGFEDVVEFCKWSVGFLED